MRPTQSPAIPIWQIGVYAINPSKGLSYQSQPDYTQFWQQLREYELAIIQEEAKYGPLPPAAKTYILDQLIIDKFPADINPLRLIKVEERLYSKIPTGQTRLANLPGVCEIGRAVISFSADITVISSDGTVIAIDILPVNYEQELDITPLILEAKYWLMQSYADELSYYIYSPVNGDQIRMRMVNPRPHFRSRLHMMLQYWYTGLVNRIAIEEE